MHIYNKHKLRNDKCLHTLSLNVAPVGKQTSADPFCIVVGYADTWLSLPSVVNTGKNKYFSKLISTYFIIV